MGSATTPSAARKIVIRILNPVEGGAKCTSSERAQRYIRNGRAYLDSRGWLVFYGRPLENPRLSGKPSLQTVDRFSGVDAFPDRAVFPPSPEALSRMGSKRSTLRPPLKSKNNQAHVG
jgi:hypothetical protein